MYKLLLSLYKSSKYYCYRKKVVKKKHTEKFLTELYSAPFKYHKDKNNLNSILNRFLNGYDYLSHYISYYKKQWFKYFENGMLDCSNISKSQRSNCFENYNRYIKLKSSKYLYDKSKCKILLPLFLYFIKNEEKDVKENIYRL